MINEQQLVQVEQRRQEIPKHNKMFYPSRKFIIEGTGWMNTDGKNQKRPSRKQVQKYVEKTIRLEFFKKRLLSKRKQLLSSLSLTKKITIDKLIFKEIINTRPLFNYKKINVENTTTIVKKKSFDYFVNNIFGNDLLNNWWQNNNNDITLHLVLIVLKFIDPRYFDKHLTTQYKEKYCQNSNYLLKQNVPRKRIEYSINHYFDIETGSNIVLVFGGIDFDTHKLLNDLWIINETLKWVKVTTFNNNEEILQQQIINHPSPRRNASIIVDNNYNLIIIGGYNIKNQYLHDMYVMADHTNKFYKAKFLYKTITKISEPHVIINDVADNNSLLVFNNTYACNDDNNDQYPLPFSSKNKFYKNTMWKCTSLNNDYNFLNYKCINNGMGFTNNFAPTIVKKPYMIYHHFLKATFLFSVNNFFEDNDEQEIWIFKNNKWHQLDIEFLNLEPMNILFGYYNSYNRAIILLYTRYIQDDNIYFIPKKQIGKKTKIIHLKFDNKIINFL